MRPVPRLVALLPALALLAACESKLAVDLSVAPPAQAATAVVLDIEDVQLLSADGATVSLDAQDAEAIDLLDHTDGMRLALVADSGDDEAKFVGVGARFSTEAAYVETTDGSRTELVLDEEAKYADLDFALSENDTATIILTLELPFSLVNRSSDLGRYLLRPVLRAVRADEAGAITGSVSRTLLDATSCRQGRARAAGVAVYAYAGTNRTPVDYYANGSVVQRTPPLASAPVRYDTSTDTYGYTLHFLPPGDYTVALTCEAADEQPQQDDDLIFVETESLKLDVGGRAEADFGD